MPLKSIYNKRFLTYLVISIWLASCVPARQFEDLQKSNKVCMDENAKLKSDNQELVTKNTEMSSSLDDLQKRISGLLKDTLDQGYAYRRLTGSQHCQR